MKPTPYDSYWNDKANWKWSLFYYCKDDPRVIVPKKPSWAGRTLNFAHKKAYYVLLATIAACFFPFLLLGKIDQTAWVILYLAIIGAIVVYFYTTDLSGE